MPQPSKFAPVFISSMVMLIISVFPFLNLINLICCAGIVLGGAAGTFYYSKQLEKAGQVIQNKDGIMIGLLAGMISAILYVISSTLIVMASGQNPIELVYKMTEQYGFQIPQESQRMLEQVYSDYQRHGFSFIMIAVELVSRVISHCIFGALGGLLAASIINKRRMSSK